MATFTISISGSSVVNGAKTWTLSDSDVQKLSDWTLATFKGPGPGPSQITLTPQQALVAWAQNFVDRTKRDVQDYNRATAVVPPVVFG